MMGNNVPYWVKNAFKRPTQRHIQELCQIPKIEHFAKIVNSLYPLTIFAKSFILDVWLGSECASVHYLF